MNIRLIDLDPKWLMKDGVRVGFTFLSPTGKQGKTHWRQSCFTVALTSGQQHELFREVHGEFFAVQGCKETIAWKVTGGINNADFNTISVMPSIDGSAGGLWHGFITDGNIR